MTAHAWLMRSPLFAACNPTIVRSLAAAARPLWVQKHSTLARAGSPVRDVLMIVEGKVVLYRRDAARRTQFLWRLVDEPQLLGDAEAVCGTAWIASARAVRDTTYLAIPVPSLLRAIQDDPRLALRVYEQSCRERLMSGYLAQTMALCDVRTRLLRFMLDWAYRLGRIESGIAHVDGLTQAEMAAGLGVTRKTIGRVMKDLEQQQRVLRDARRGSWQLPNLAELEATLPAPPLGPPGTATA